LVNKKIWLARTLKRDIQMTNKELIILGKALQALLELGAIEKTKEIADIMASDGDLKIKEKE
jgi:hypothetical protein